MSQFLNEGKTFMGEIWTIFVVFVGLLASQLNATSSLSSSSFHSRVLLSISAASTFVLNATTPGPMEASSVNTSVVPQLPTNSSLKTKTSVLSISVTRTFHHSTAVVLAHSQNVNASHGSTRSAMSSSSSTYFFNSSVEASSASSVILSPESASNAVSALRTSSALLHSSVSKGNHSSVLVLGSSSSVKTTSLTSVVFSTVDPPSFLSTTRTFQLTQTSPSNDPSVGLSSHSRTITSMLPLGTTHGVLLTSAAMTATRTSSIGYPTNSIKGMSTYASQSVMKSSSASKVSSTVLTNTAAKSVSGRVNETVSMPSLMSESMLGMLNSSASSLYVAVPVISTLKAPVSPAVAILSDTTVLSVFQGSSSVLHSTIQTSAVFSSVKLGVNHTSSVTVTAAFSPPSIGLNKTIFSAKTTTAVLPPNAATVSSFAGPGMVSSNIANSSSEMSRSLSRSLPVSPHLTTSQNAKGQPLSSVQLNTSSMATPVSSVDGGILSSSTVGNETSTLFSVLPSPVTSHHVTSQSVKTSSVSSTISPLHTSVSAASSSLVSVTIKQPSSVPVVSSGLADASTFPSKSTLPSLPSPVTPNRTPTGDGLIVMSSSYPCYIYYVVEKTVFPATTANYTLIPATTPKVTLDINSATNMHSNTPTVTLTHPVIMSTQRSEMHSQVVSSSRVLRISEVVFTSKNIVPILSSSRSSIRPTLISSHTPLLPSETLTRVLSTDSHKVIQTDTSTGSLMSSPVSMPHLPDSRGTTINTFKETSLLTQVQPSSFQQQSGTIAIPFVSHSVSDLTNSSMVNRTLGFFPGTTSPVVATPSVSGKQTLTTGSALLSNLSTTVVLSDSGNLSMEATSSVHDFADAVTSLSSQTITFVPTSSIASKMKSNGTTMVVESTEVFVLQTIADSVETPKPSTLPKTTSTPTFTQRISSSNTATLRSSVTMLSNSLMEHTSTTTRTPSVEASSETHTSQVTSISGEQLSSLMRSSSVNVTQVGTVNTLVVSSLQDVASSLTTQSFTSNAGELRSLVSSSFRAMSQISVISSSIATGHKVVATSSLSPANNQSSSRIDVYASSSDFQASSTTSSGSVGQLPSVLPSFSGSASQDGASSNPTVNSLRETSSSSLHAGTTSSLINSEPRSSVPLLSSFPSGRRRKKRAVGVLQTNSSEPTPVLPTSSVIIQTNTAVQTGHYSVSTSVQSSSGKSQNISAHIASTTQVSSQQIASSFQALASQTTVFYSSTGRSSFLTEQNLVATSSSFLVSLQTVTATTSVNSSSQSVVSSNSTEISNLKPSRTVAKMINNTSTFFIDQTVSQRSSMTLLKSSAVLAISSSTSLSAVSSSEQIDSVGTSSAAVGIGTSSFMFAPGVRTSSAIVFANSSSTSVLLLTSRKPTPLPGAVTSSVAIGTETLSPMSSQDSIALSVEVLREKSSAAFQSASGPTSHKEATSSLVSSPSAAASKGALPSTISQLFMTSSAAVLGSRSSTVVQTAESLSSHQPNITLVVITPSTFIRHDTLALTSSVALTASAVSISSTSRVVSMPREQSSSTGSVNGSTSSFALMRSSVLMGRNSKTVATDTVQPSSTLFADASKSASMSRLLRKASLSFEAFAPAASSAYQRSDSLTQQARGSSVRIVSSPLPTKTTNLVLSTLIGSPQASHSVVPASLQSFIAPTSELLSSRRTGHPGETSQQTVSSLPATTASSSRVYKPPLVTISSLGICWVIYTTRLVQPSLIPTPQINISFTTSVNVSSTHRVSLVTSRMNTSSVAQVSPTETLNTSFIVLLPTLTVNASSSHFSAVSSAVSPTGVSSIDAVLSTVYGPDFNSSSLLSTSIQVRKSSQVPQNTVDSVVRATSPLLTATPVLSRVPATSTTKTSSLVQPVTSHAVSSTPSATEAVSSSVSVPTTQPPDPSVLLVVTVTVGPNTIIESNQFQGGLESNLAGAYRFAKLSQEAVNATIQSIQRVNEGDNITVIFFMTNSSQRIPAAEAARNFNGLRKDQLTHFLNLNVVTLPQPLVQQPTTPVQQPTTPVQQPTTPVPQKALVSLIIQSSAGNNISIPANKATLELKLALYYKDKKQLSAPANVTAKIATILHEPNEKTYLEFYILVDGKKVNRTDVVETFKVSNVNLLTAKLVVRVLFPVYIPDSLKSSELDRVIIVISVSLSQDLKNSSFRSDLANKLATLYVEGKGRKSSRRKRRSGSTSATIVDISRRSNSKPEADVTFFVFDSGVVVNGTYVTSVMNRLNTGEMTTVTRPYAVLVAPKPALVPTTPTEVIPTVALTPIKWWIIPAVLCPIVLIIVIILLVCWRWRKGAPKAKVEPDTIRMLEANRGRAPPVRGYDVARYTEPGVSSMKTTSFMSGTGAREEEEEREKPARRARETSLRRKVGKPPVQKLPTREQKQTNPAYEEEEEEEEESVVSVTPTGSTTGLIGTKTRKTPSATERTPIPPQRSHEPQTRLEPQRPQELSEDESGEESEVSSEETGTENESVAPPPQAKHSAAQVPTVAVMSEASGPPRYPPVRFRSSVHPAPSLPPLNTKQTSLVGVRVEAPSEDDAPKAGKKRKSLKGELEQRADLERQKNKQRLRDRRRDSERAAVPPERRAWDRAQHDFDDVLGEEETAERVITGKKVKRRRRRPPSSSVATDEEGIPHLKSYRKLRSPKTTASSNTSTRDHGKKRGKSADSDSNVSSDESEIDMGETRRRMHTMLDDAFALFGPQSAKKPPAMDPQELSSLPQGYLATPQRPPAVPRYNGGQPALPEPPPAHGRATEPTPGQRRRIQPAMPGYPAAMPHTPIGVPGYPVRPPMRPVVTRDPIVVWDPADRQRFLNQRAPPPTYAYRDPSGQNLYITPVHQQRDDMGGLVWSPYAAEDSMDALYPDLAQSSYPGALGTTPPKDASFLSHLQAAPPHDTILNMSAKSTLDQREATLGQSPQPLIKSIKDELFRLSQGAQRKTPIAEL